MCSRSNREINRGVIPEYSYLLNGKDLCGMGLLDESARIRDGNPVLPGLSDSSPIRFWLNHVHHLGHIVVN